MQFIFYFLFFQFIIFYDQCNIAKALTGRQVRPADNGQFPFIVSIQHVDAADSYGNGHRCAGALITTTDILTIGHCVRNQLLSNVRALVGSNDLRTGTYMELDWWLHYNEWAAFLHVPLRAPTNEIVYMKLAESIPSSISLARLTNRSMEHGVERRVIVAGWSRTPPPESHIMPLLRRAGLRLLTKEDCDRGLSQISASEITTDERIVCSFANPPITFDEGDYGNPTIIGNDELVALALATCPNYSGTSIVINMHYSISFYADIISYMLSLG